MAVTRSRATALLISFLLFVSIVPNRVLGDEGMFLPDALNDLPIKKLQQMGLKVPLTDIYNPNGPSIKDAVVIVDVFSFSTAVDIALSRGASVLPYRWKDGSASRFARDHGALLAESRTVGGPYSLSPDSLLSVPPGTRLVIPSPNGSTSPFFSTFTIPAGSTS